MNYLKELHAFKQWIRTHELPTSAIILWHSLMLLHNSSGQKQVFSVPNGEVEILTGLSRQGITDARTILVEKGLIRYQKGRIGKAPVYQMLSLCGHSVNPNDNVNSTDKDNINSNDKVKSVDSDHVCSVDQVQSVDMSLSTEPTLLKEREEEERRRRVREQNPIIIYEQNFGVLRPIIRESFLAWCEDLGDEIVIAAIKLAVQKGGMTYSYIEQILKEWANAKLETIEQVRTHELKKKSNKQKSISFYQSKKGDHQGLFNKLRQEGM
ncbi:DnaD domain-containing protein [Aquibacillus sediminis]|uniref:DnaD domain-containing protein n=1 Tax=Aquibacillus sediminis TaxID=2574734 RepID=UPI00110973D6|nr:DnaD domain protein [Aquibacillus sediminis]